MIYLQFQYHIVFHYIDKNKNIIIGSCTTTTDAKIKDSDNIELIRKEIMKDSNCENLIILNYKLLNKKIRFKRK